MRWKKKYSDTATNGMTPLYIIREEGMNDFMKFRVQAKRLFPRFFFVDSLEEALAKASNRACVVVSAHQHFHYNAMKMWEELLATTPQGHRVRLSDKQDRDAFYVPVDGMKEGEDVQGPLIFASSGSWEFSLYDFASLEYKEEYGVVAEAYGKDYRNYFRTFLEVSYPTRSLFERHTFRYFRPFLVMIQMNHRTEIAALRLCQRLSAQRYPHFRILVLSPYLVTDMVPDTLFVTGSSMIWAPAQWREKMSRISSKSEWLILVKDAQACLDSLNLYGLNKELLGAPTVETDAFIGINANEYVYNFPHHLFLGSGTLGPWTEMAWLREKRTLCCPPKPFDRLERFLQRKDFEEGLRLINFMLASSTSDVLRLTLAKISFASLCQNYREMETEIFKSITVFPNDYETLNNIFIIVNSCDENNINEEVKKRLYLKLLEFPEESKPQCLFILFKLASIKHVSGEELSKMIRAYARLETKNDDGNKAFLERMMRKIAIEHPESNLLSDLMEVVSKDFRMFTLLESDRHLEIIFNLVEKYYPELILHVCDHMGQYLYDKTDDILARRRVISHNVDILLRGWKKVYTLRQIMGLTFQNFALSYHGVSSRDIFVKKSLFVRKICPSLNYCYDRSRDVRREQEIALNGGRLRIGFLSPFLNRMHSVYKDRHMIIHRLAEHHEVYFFTLQDLDPSVKFTFGKAQHIKLEEDLEKMQTRVDELALDILVYCEIGMHPFIYYLAHMRLARYQLNTWGHSDTSGINTIDYFMTSIYYDNEKTAAANYSEKAVLLRSLCTFYKNPLKRHDTSLFKTRRALGFSQEVHLYLCPQSLFKFSPTFLPYLQDILEKDPKGIIVILDAMAKRDLLLERLDAFHSSFLGRIHFVSAMQHFDYLNLINVCDVMIDTYPFGGCNSSLEAFSLGKMVVTQTAGIINGRFTTGFLRKMGMKEFICKSRKDYVAMAVKIATNPKLQEQIRVTLKEKEKCIFEEEASVTTWKEFLEGLYSNNSKANYPAGNNAETNT